MKRTPSKKTADAAKPDVTSPADAVVADAVVADIVVADEATAEAVVAGSVESAPAAETTPVVGEAPVAPRAPAKRPVRRPARKPAPPAKEAAPVEAPVEAAPVDEPPVEAARVEAARVEEAAEVEVETAAAPSAVAVVEPQRQAEAIENVTAIENITVVENGDAREIVLKVAGLVKRFDEKTAVAGIDLEIRAGSFFGIVGPNGAGKTTTLSMVTGLLKPDAGQVTVHGADVWSNPVVAKRTMGVLPDRLRLFDRLTGAQLLYYSGILHGLEKSVVRSRSADLSAAFGLEDSLDRLVTDYSAGMTKKIAIAAAMIHSPRLLVLDEPFESVDPVSAANVIEILQKYVAAGGTVVMSSHTMNLIERICDSVAVIVNGAVLATGTMAEVRGDKSLEDRFVELAGGRKAAEGMEWLHKFSD